MDFGLEIRELDPPHAVAVACSGVSGRGDVARIEAAAADPRVRAARRVVLDLRRLGSASPYLIKAVVAWQRSLVDRGASLVVLGANSVIRWRLARARGVLPLPEADGPDAARTAPLERLSQVEVGGIPETESETADGGPQVGLSGALNAAEPVVGAQTALREAGLAERVALVPVRGGALVPPSHLGCREQTGELVRRLQAGLGPLDSADLDRDACGLAELALLNWSGADILIPLREAGELQGVLAVRTGRGGLAGFRSGEILALELLGLWLGRRLAAGMPSFDVPAAAVAQDLLDAVPLEAV